jgi:NgoBV restriction endonuclease
MSAKKLYETLISEGIVGATGETNFELHGVKTLVNDSSIVGNVIQEWLMTFMKKKKIAFRTETNTQAFPDFYMHKTDDQIDLLEVKCFKNSPNFDIANFLAYATSLCTEAYRLDSDYLIFEYSETKAGILIKNLWLKKVWEICSASERTAINLQIKKGNYYAIRPRDWRSKKSKFDLFESRLDFVKAIEKTVNGYPTANQIQKNWFQNVRKTYAQQTGRDL